MTERGNCAILLAAGRSRRMGEEKLLLDLGGISVVARTLGELRRSSVESIVAVVRSDSPEIRAAVMGERTLIVENDDPDRGRTRSLKLGLSALSDLNNPILMVLADMPLVRPGTYDLLLEEVAKEPTGILIPSYAERRGHPVALSQGAAQRILQLGDDDPLNIVTRGPHGELGTDDPGIHVNLNTWHDYAEARSTLNLETEGLNHA